MNFDFKDGNVDICNQKNGTAILKALGSIFGIPGVSDCDTAVVYYTRSFNNNMKTVCEILVDKALEAIPGEGYKKSIIRGFYSDLQIDPNATTIRDLCKCSCKKGTDIANNFTTRKIV